MNAHDAGKELGFAHKISYLRISKEAFEKIGKHQAKHGYLKEKKQAEFLAGWMTNWTEPHPKDCQCKDCTNPDLEVLTY